MQTTSAENRERMRMMAQFYLDMSKYLLTLMFAYGLFAKELDGTIARPLIVILTFICMASVGVRAERWLSRIDADERVISKSEGDGL